MDQQQNSRELVARLIVILIAGLFWSGLIVFLVVLGYSVEWTGFGPARAPKGVQPAKTMWDWLALLLPVYTAVIVTVFGVRITRQQSTIQHQVEERRAREAAVQTYVDETLNLLANGGLRDLRDSQRSEELRVLLRARTRMVLDRIDATDKKSIVRFLHDAGLIRGEQPAVSLDGADLSGVVLSGVDLSDANLSGANLSDAQAITNEELEQQVSTLEGATMPNGQKYEDWLKEMENRREDG
jgi:hypothetical protein